MLIVRGDSNNAPIQLQRLGVRGVASEMWDGVVSSSRCSYSTGRFSRGSDEELKA